jgi:hypothetical protein
MKFYFAPCDTWTPVLEPINARAATIYIILLVVCIRLVSETVSSWMPFYVSRDYSLLTILKSLLFSINKGCTRVILKSWYYTIPKNEGKLFSILWRNVFCEIRRDTASKLWAGELGVQVPIGERVLSSPKCLDTLWSPPSAYFGSFLVVIRSEPEATNLYLVPKLRMKGSVPVLPQHALVSWTEIVLLFYFLYCYVQLFY